MYYQLSEDANLIDGSDLIGPKVRWIDIGDKSVIEAIKDGTITVVSSDDEGKAIFSGIPSDNYYLKEVKAPDGYNVMAEDMLVELSTDATADFEVRVKNNTGALLPETGGTGTVLITMFGLLLMSGAVVLYLINRKVKQN